MTTIEFIQSLHLKYSKTAELLNCCDECSDKCFLIVFVSLNLFNTWDITTVLLVSSFKVSIHQKAKKSSVTWIANSSSLVSGNRD